MGGRNGISYRAGGPRLVLSRPPGRRPRTPPSSVNAGFVCVLTPPTPTANQSVSPSGPRCVSHVTSIAELLERIQHSGYRLGVISNHVTSWLQAMFVQLGYTPLFYPAAAGAATAKRPIVVVSDAAKSGKPEPEVYTSFLTALKQATGQEDAEDAAVAATCVFLDNKQKNVDAAERAGFHGVLYEAYGGTEAELETMLTAAGVFIDPVDLDY